MPRSKKKTVYHGSCVECGAQSCHVRVAKAKKADFRKLHKYCKTCKKRTEAKLKEEKHSS